VKNQLIAARLLPSSHQFFRGKTAQPSSAVLSIVAKKSRDEYQMTDVYVLTETTLQKWRVSLVVTEKVEL